MNSNKLISIVLPVYNGADHISESIKSVLQQTYSNWELIIVNDCSTDNTPEIIENFRKSDSRIRILHNAKNMKLPTTLNVGFAAATGTYFTWTSDDNMYRPNALEKMVAVLEENHTIDFVYADHSTINNIGKLIRKEKREEPSEIRFYYMVGACFMYRSSLANKVGEYDPKTFLAEDYDYCLRCYNYTDFFHIHEDLYICRKHDKSLTSTRVKEIAHQVKYVLEKHFNFIISKCPTQEEKNRYFWSILNRFETPSIFPSKEIRALRKKYYKIDKFFAKADRKRRLWAVFAKCKLGARKILKFILGIFR